MYLNLVPIRGSSIQPQIVIKRKSRQITSAYLLQLNSIPRNCIQHQKAS